MKYYYCFFPRPQGTNGAFLGGRIANISNQIHAASNQIPKVTPQNGPTCPGIPALDGMHPPQMHINPHCLGVPRARGMPPHSPALLRGPGPVVMLVPGAILIIGKRRISITAGIWGTPVRHNNTEPSVHVCAALLGRCGSNFEFSKPLAASPASPNPPTAAARRVRSCTTSRAPRGLLLPPTTRHYATVDNAGLCSPTSHPELPCRARSWPAR